MDFSKSEANDNLPAGGAAAIILGIMTLTIQYTVTSTHTWGGVNYAGVFNTSMMVIGFGLLLLGSGIFVSLMRPQGMGG